MPEQKTALALTKPGVKILIVDDNPLNLKVAKNLLDAFKPTVLVATSGKAALNCLEKQQVDLILLDYLMPEMDGLQTLKAIRAAHALIPVVAFTADTTAQAKETLLAYGFDDVLLKPIEANKLESILCNFKLIQE